MAAGSTVWSELLPQGGASSAEKGNGESAHRVVAGLNT